jgi:hypothetical protein
MATSTALDTAVYRTLDGGIHHTACGRRMTFRGRPAGLSFEFNCPACGESVMITAELLASLVSGRPELPPR